MNKQEELINKFPFLKKQSDSNVSSVNLASKNIKSLLTYLWPKTKLSVKLSKFSGGNSIDIHYTDGPSSKQVYNIVCNFKEGNFNGMIDLYEYSSNDWHIFGSAKYISVHKNSSDSTKNNLIPYVRLAMNNVKASSNNSSLFPINTTDYFLNYSNSWNLWTKTHFVNQCYNEDSIVETILDAINIEPTVKID